MPENAFTESDKQKLIEFLNMVAKHATFSLKTEEVIVYFKLLAHMQQVVVPKVSAHVFEVVRVVEASKDEKAK